MKYVPAVEGKEPARSETVLTRKGKVQGVVTADGAVEVFAGIPYAKAPTGELRWRAPQPASSWPGTLICDHFQAMSMQPTNLPIYDSLARIIGYHDYRISLTDNYVPPVSEDSLYINLWRPKGAEGPLPVLVFIHGGSTEATVELSRITRRNRPSASGEAHSALTAAAPADSPASVTLSGSPPKAAMLSRTHSSAAIWSSMP